MAFRKPKKFAGEDLKDYALKLLAGRSMSSGQVRQKLRDRAEDPGEVDRVMASLREYGLVDDQRFAEHFTAVRRDSRGVGRQRALADLMSKRVAPGLARKAVEDAYSGTDELQLVEQYLERKYRGKNLATELKDERKLASVFRRLRTAGFSAGSSIRVLKRYAAAAEQLPEEEGPAEPEP